MSGFTLDALETIIAVRAGSGDPGSYTRKLLDAGMAKCAKKLGEEGVEAALAAVSGDRIELVKESADVLFHLLVVLRAADVPLAEAYAELERRTVRTGLEEKASRPAE